MADHIENEGKTEENDIENEERRDLSGDNTQMDIDKSSEDILE